MWSAKTWGRLLNHLKQKKPDTINFDATESWEYS